MSSASVKVANAMQFRDQVYSKRIPDSDKLISTPMLSDRILVGNSVNQEAFQYVIPQGVNWGSQMTFTIPRSVGSIYRMFLEIDLPGDPATINYCPYIAVAMVKNYQVYVGNELINCSGDAMYTAAQSYLEVHGRQFYASAACGSASGSAAAGGDKVFLLCDYPGAFNVTIPNAIFTHDESYSIAFPLNKCNNDMNIRITLPSTSEVVTGGTLGSTDLPQFKLWYQSIWSSEPSFNLVNNTGNGNSIHIPGYRINEYSTFQNITTSPNSIDMSAPTQFGQMLRFLFRVSTPTQVSTRNYFQGTAVDQQIFTVAGVEYHKTYNLGETMFRQSDWNRQDSFQDGELNPYVFIINGSPNPFSIPNDEWFAINVFRNNPRLSLANSTALPADCTVKFIVITKCDYIISPSGMVNFYTSSEN